MNRCITYTLFLVAVARALIAAPLSSPGEVIDRERLLKGEVIVRLTEVDSERGIKEGQTIGWIRADTQTIWDVVTDYGHYAEFMPHVAESRIEAQEGSVVHLYNRLALPWPLQDIWYVDRIEENQAQGTIQWRMVRGNIAVNYGSWKLEPFRQGTIVSYTVFTDVSTLLPAWAQNIVTRITLPKMIKVLRKRVKHCDASEL